MTEVNTGIPVFADSAARDAAFGGSGEKVLAEGQFAFLEDSNTTQYYDGAVWETLGASGMTFISATTMTGQNVNINDCFSATYSSYLVVFDNVIFNNATGRNLTFRLRVGGSDNSTASSYTQTLVFGHGTTNGAQSATASDWSNTSVNNGGAFFGSILFHGPFAVAKTNVNFDYSVYSASGFQVVYSGFGSHNQSTSYDGFSILQSAQSFTSGTCRVYGLANS
jgi:hypothetical protein